jgi:signal transduction histidine kinase
MSPHENAGSSSFPVSAGIPGVSSQDSTRGSIQKDAHSSENSTGNTHLAEDLFLASLSHDLRTPLTPILYAAQLLEGEEGLSAEAREHIAVIKRSVMMEVQLIEDLLDLNRILHGKLKLKVSLVDLHAVLKVALEISTAQAEESHLKRTVELAAEASRVMGNESRLQQVFVNLLANAAKYTPEGGHIQVSSKVGDRGCIEVLIADHNATGHDPHSALPLLTAYQAGEKGERGAHGLGLEIAKSLLELQGGYLSGYCASAGCGPRLKVTMPLS